MTKFIFEDGEVIEVNDKAIAEVLRTDKRYKELKDNEGISAVPLVNEELEKLKAEKKELEKALEKANNVPKNAKELKAANDELTAKNEELQKEVDELKSKIEELTKTNDLSLDGGEDNGEAQE